MSALPVAAIIILVLVLGLLIGWTILITKNNNISKSTNVLVPFSAFLSNGDKVTNEGDEGDEQQISCPTGTKINIVAAYYDVYDPHNQCSDKPSDTVNPCDPSNTPICNNADDTGANSVCKPGGTGDCRMRDATGYLGAQCNGIEGDCDVTINRTFFGPEPCNVINPQDALYNKLPALPGEKQGYYVHGIYACDPK